MRRRTVLALGALALAAGCGTQAPPYQREISLVVPPDGWGERAAGELKALIEGRRWAREVRLTRGADEGGTTALGRFAATAGRTDLLITGTALLAESVIGRRESFVDRVTPLARLAGEWEVLVASPGSRFRTFDEFAAALLRDPAGAQVAGGPEGGTDHLLYGMMAIGLGADPRLVDYVAFDDRARAVSAVVDGQTALGFGTPREVIHHIRAGRLRPLAVSSPERLDGIDAPTLSESGVRVAYADWWGLVASGALTDRERDALLDLCGAVAGSGAWRHCCGRNGWSPMYLAGDDFRSWLTDEARRTARVLNDLGLR